MGTVPFLIGGLSPAPVSTRSSVSLPGRDGFQNDVEVVGTYTRSYHDTRRPFANYRFLDELNRALGHNLDRAMDGAAATGAFLRSPRLWFFALFGYGFPSAVEPAILVRKR